MKYDDKQLETTRLQNRIDSLEFYSRTSTNFSTRERDRNRSPSSTRRMSLSGRQASVEPTNPTTYDMDRSTNFQSTTPLAYERPKTSVFSRYERGSVDRDIRSATSTVDTYDRTKTTDYTGLSRFERGSVERDIRPSFAERSMPDRSSYAKYDRNVSVDRPTNPYSSYDRTLRSTTPSIIADKPPRSNTGLPLKTSYLSTLDSNVSRYAYKPSSYYTSTGSSNSSSTSSNSNNNNSSHNAATSASTNQLKTDTILTRYYEPANARRLRRKSHLFPTDP